MSSGLLKSIQQTTLKLYNVYIPIQSSITVWWLHQVKVQTNTLKYVYNNM
jgi:hypothetical protein